MFYMYDFDGFPLLTSILVNFGFKLYVRIKLYDLFGIRD